jgi:hypothetical protein
VAFGVEIGDSLTHNMIIIHLRKALDKWIAFENKSNEHQFCSSNLFTISSKYTGSMFSIIFEWCL